MSQGLFTAVTGLKACQSQIDVISDNIANTNTTGFKASSVNFENIFVKTFSTGSAPLSNTGGTNPIQIGYGVGISEVSRDFSSGSVQTTGVNSDINIQGEGFFTLNDFDGTSYLSRDGSFLIDSEGKLFNSKGLMVMGTDEVVSDIPSTTNARVPAELYFRVGLDAGGQLALVKVYDGDATVPDVGDDTDFDGLDVVTDGVTKLQSFTIGKEGQITATYDDGNKLTVEGEPTRALKFFTSSGLETSSTTVLQVQDESVKVAELQLQMAKVLNPKGLVAQSGNMFLLGANSGAPIYGVGGKAGLGQVEAGGLETSNVDLANEFANMILAQRGIDANSRTFGAQNQIIRTIVNIGR